MVKEEIHEGSDFNFSGKSKKFTDWSLVPKDAELIYIGQTYTDDEVIQKAKEADAILVDAVNAVSGKIIRHLPNLKLVNV